MWAFVYEGEGGYTKDFDNNLNVRVDDGQYFFQDEGSSGIFWTYDRQRGGYKRVAGAENTKYPGVWYFIDVYLDINPEVPVQKPIIRLDTFNCLWYGGSYCNPGGLYSSGGSVYSLRSDISVYLNDGSFYETIKAADYDVVIANNYGYTKATDTSGLNCGGSGILISGKRRKSDGTIIDYYPLHTWASELICADPLNGYKINTR